MNTQTMRAVQAPKAGGPFACTEIAVPEPGRGQVRVRVHACGVCGGDAIARNGLLGVTLPRVPGHEIGGVIDAVGEGVVVWKVGQRVGVGWQGGIARRAISAELAILLTAPTLRWSGFRMMAAMPNIWSCRNSPWLAFRMSCLSKRPVR